MKKRTWMKGLAAAGAVALLLAACGQSATVETSDAQEEQATDTVEEATPEASEETAPENPQGAEENAEAAQSGRGERGGGHAGGNFGFADKSADAELQSLIADVAGRFTQQEYADAETGLSVTYNLFLPEGYSESGSYPMTVFIADSSLAGKDAKESLTQGYGALVWASADWQAEYPGIVLVPTYPETILDDHNGYSTTEYVELTKRLMDSVCEQYAVDASRIYGTGQSMGCMTTLILASEYPDLYAGCMFVDGQWDVSALTPLIGQKFVYFAAEGDSSAYNGMNELKAAFTEAGADYSEATWDATWTQEELSAAAQSLFSEGNSANYVAWLKGTVLPEGTPEGTSEHMYSFDYAYKATAARE